MSTCHASVGRSRALSRGRFGRGLALFALQNGGDRVLVESRIDEVFLHPALILSLKLFKLFLCYYELGFLLFISLDSLLGEHLGGL